MTGNDQERLSQLVRASFASLGDPSPPNDLWPQVLGRIHERPHVSPIDRTLLGVLLAFGVLAPRSVLWLMYSV